MASVEYRRRCDEQTRGEALYRRYASVLPGGDFKSAHRPWRVDDNWLVLHWRSPAERSELLLSSVPADGNLFWTPGLSIERPERLLRLDARNLFLSGRGGDGGWLVWVDLRRGSGIVHRPGRGDTPSQRVEWLEGQP